MYLYLAGALTYHYKNNQFLKATEWRNLISIWCKNNVINYFDPAITFILEQGNGYNGRACVDQNRYYLNKSNILIADINDIIQSPGTQWELCYASEVKKIPIISFGEKHWSPHINHGISYHCKDIQEVIDLLEVMYSQR